MKDIAIVVAGRAFAWGDLALLGGGVLLFMILVMLRQLMRARRVSTQSELINSLLSEEEERLEAEQVLRETAGSAKKSDIHEELL